MDSLEKIRRRVPWKRHFMNFRNHCGKSACWWKQEKLNKWGKALRRRRARRVPFMDRAGEFISGNRNLLKKASRHLL